MAERKYSVAEIDRMRQAVGAILHWPQNPARIEEQLRTYMLNGTSPAELMKAADDAVQRWHNHMNTAAAMQEQEARA